jgi:hypothetical protein
METAAEILQASKHCLSISSMGAIVRKHLADLLIARFPPQNPPHLLPKYTEKIIFRFQFAQFSTFFPETFL